MTLAVRDSSIPDSPLARWDARWKLAAFIVAVIGTISLRTPVAGAVALATGVLLAFVSRIPVGVLAGRIGGLALAVLPFIALVPLTQAGGGSGWDVGPVRVSEHGLIAAVVIALRIVAVGTFALVLIRTGPLARTFAAAHDLLVPGVIVQVAQLAHRYTFLLAAEARRVRVALKTRGFRAGTNRHTYRTLGHGVGSLLVRSGDRADRVADAMRCRGFDGTYRSATEPRTTRADVVAFLAAAVAMAALVLVDRQW
ncbi:cobalt ECF transporter T component CbiQ [Fimbriiglobus ruber]|uniref:Transmembrane component NikQ of energizing module of nickel ECF transporter n=1 Tax=Fimbriiglobus ruber TaxID=1908690 RepID=A0A225D682_9BACT|nr:cobalt ECF transporter T component CbiQ [Fimbriiglobus ruber]OWK36972.1 Transmembrane component NikQ of energizing module of nickel ECF transporter [Fimbriiglobus ruber]